jgi:short-subunit dehydrogenase
MGRWDDKVVIVTGGSAGLGRAVSAHWSAAGSRVVIVARHEAALQEVAKSLSGRDNPVHAIPADVTQQTDVDHLFARVRDQFGRLDVLINCAGRSDRGAAAETTPAAFETLWQLNFLASVRCAQAAIPLLSRTNGHLVNIGSLASKIAGPYLGAYPASKFAVAAFSHQLRLEIPADDVHVLLVCPGPIARADAGTRYAEKTAHLPASARKPGGGAKLKGIPSERLAQLIMKACERRQPELIVPGRARWLFGLSQLWPALGDKLIRRMTE